jgi:hypothetical protein
VKKLAFFPDGLPFWFELVERVRFAALVHALTTNGHERTRIHKKSLYAHSFLLFAPISVD